MLASSDGYDAEGTFSHYDYTYDIKSKKPDDKIIIKLLRKDKELNLSIIITKK